MRRPDDEAFLDSRSRAMREVLERARKVARSPSTPVLLEGESGTGKKVIARLIHDETPARRDGPFVSFDCAAIAEGVLESELSGHERGQRGLLDLAAEGTLLLDKIGELGLAPQTRFLRALATTTVRRRGGTRHPSVRARIIAVTNRNLEQEVAAGRFRPDLFHRLDVFHLTVPPLRERREDIPELASFLLERIARRLGRVPPKLSREAEGLVVAYGYPGNARELRNILERALILEPGPQITPASLVLGTIPRGCVIPPQAFFTAPLLEGRPPTLAELEKAYVERLLAHTSGNRSQVARLLNVSYPTVAKKIADYDIKVPK